MFTTVVERQKEIGTLKAVGYTSKNILSIFLVEASITGFIGGSIGAGAGVRPFLRGCCTIFRIRWW